MYFCKLAVGGRGRGSFSENVTYRRLHEYRENSIRRRIEKVMFFCLLFLIFQLSFIKC